MGIRIFYTLFIEFFCSTTLILLLLVGASVSAAQEVSVKDSASPKKSANGDLKGMFDAGDSKDPVFIRSDSLALNSKARVFTYQGNVEIIRADVKITADAVIGRYDANNRLQTIVCEDNVVVTRGEDLRASSDRAVYHVPTATIVLTEGPELARGGNVLSADKITVFVNEDKSEAEGNVRVKVIQEGEGTSLLEKARSDRETGAKGGAQETTQE